MNFLYKKNYMSILEYHKSYITSYNIKDIDDYCYHIAKYNNKKNNIEIIIDYVDKGDYIENDFLSENLNKPIRIRQIAHILLERYLSYRIDTNI